LIAGFTADRVSDRVSDEREIRDQRSEIREQRTENRDQRIENRKKETASLLREALPKGRRKKTIKKPNQPPAG